MEPSLSPLLTQLDVLLVKSKGLVVKLVYLGHRKPPTSYYVTEILKPHRRFIFLNFSLKGLLST